MMTDKLEAITKSLNTLIQQSGERLGYLHDRWQDEKEYEDFAEYVNVMKSITPSPFTFVKATRKPFGFVLKHPDATVSFQIFANSRSCSWKAFR